MHYRILSSGLLLLSIISGNAFAQHPLPAASSQDTQPSPASPTAEQGREQPADSGFGAPVEGGFGSPRSASDFSQRPSGAKLISLELSSDDPSVGYDVYGNGHVSGSNPPDFSCASHCRLMVPAGDYEIRIRETDSTMAGSRWFELSRNTRIHFDPDSKAKRSAGLALGIGGPIIGAVGYGVALGRAGDCSSHGCGLSDSGFLLGAGMMVLGSVLGPIGWGMFATSIRPEYDLTEAESSVSRVRKTSPTFSVGAVPAQGGFAFGGSVLF